MAMWQRAVQYGASLLATLIVVAVSGAALAQDQWRVTGVPVDVTAGDAVAARRMAIETGQREGLRTLMQRITATSDARRLPSVDTVPLGPLVRSYEITDERVGATRYTAKLNVTYNGEAVQALLRDRGIAFTPGEAPGLLLLPALLKDGNLILWQQDEPWHQALASAAAKERAINFLLPLGDVEDVTTLPPARALAHDTGAMARLAQRYGARDAVLVVAEPRGTAAAPYSIVVRFSAGSGGLFDGDPPGLDQVGASPDLIQRAADQSVQRLVQAWKRQVLSQPEQGERLSLVVPLADLASWVQIRRELEAMPEVREVQVESFSRQRAQLGLTYVGEIGRLQEALARRGLQLGSESEGWQLRPVGTQPAPRG